MKKIISGKSYDTGTATLIGGWDNGHFANDMEYASESLYRKKTGEFFLHCYGGPMTRYSEYDGERWCFGECIQPLKSSDDARRWAESHLDADEYTAAFGDPGEGEETAVTVRISPAAKRRLDEERERTGETQGAIVERLLLGL